MQPPKPKWVKVDPSIIDRAPLELDDRHIEAPDFEGFYIKLVGDLQEEVAELRTQLARSQAEETIEQVRARLIEPYVKAVFRFVTCYCVFVGIVLLVAGWKGGGFALSDTILGIIAGSTAVSVIGLIGLVITGLFGTAKATGPLTTRSKKSKAVG